MTLHSLPSAEQAVFSEDDNSLGVNSLVSLPARQGGGRMLIKAVEEQARKRHKTAVTLGGQ